MYDKQEDVQHFGEDVWVYCRQHMRPHKTGWCTVASNEKVKLDATSQEDAYAECRAREFALAADREPQGN